MNAVAQIKSVKIQRLTRIENIIIPKNLKVQDTYNNNKPAQSVTKKGIINYPVQSLKNIDVHAHAMIINVKVGQFIIKKSIGKTRKTRRNDFVILNFL